MKPYLPHSTMPLAPASGPSYPLGMLQQRGPKVSHLTVGEALRWAEGRLEASGVAEPRLEARLLLQDALALDTARLYLRRAEALGEEDLAAYTGWVERRTRHEPLAYITGHAEFYGLDLRVDRRVLMPRPETELLVEAALAWARASALDAPLGADVGTGSGCVALALTAHAPQLHIYATDVSEAALAVARENARRLALQGRVTFLVGRLLNPLPGPVDLLVANLPYIPTTEIETLMPEVRKHEPRLALDGGPDGLELLRQLLAAAPGALRPGGALFLEVGAGQGDRVLELAQHSFPRARRRLLPDLAGIPRVLAVELSQQG